MSASMQQAFSFTPITTEPPRRNVVIEAGAGTGKTTAIVAEVLRILLGDTDVAPEKIVLVTFTEKAAGEIADRIHDALREIDAGEGNIAWPIGSPHPLFTAAESARARCERQLARIDSLRSQTIHSFCQSLLRQFPIEAGLDPQFTIVEGFERALLHGDIYDAWIDHETRIAPDPERLYEWETLAGNGVYLFQIREAVLNLVGRRDLIDDTTYDFGDVAEFEARLLDAISEIRIHGDATNPITQHVRAKQPPDTDLDAWIDYLAPIAHEIRTQRLPRGPLKEAYKTLRWSDSTGTSAYDRFVSHRAAAAILTLTRRFIRFLDEEKRKLGVVDFDDLLLRTAAVLENEIVLELIRAQFDFIFVDEFQDTDRTQARILDLLGRDRSGSLVPGKMIVVGDSKQSIYGFRRADPETFDRFTRAMRDAGAEHRLLRDQYRSEKPLLDAVNAIFATIFRDAGSDPNVFRPAYHPLIAAKGGDAAEPRITLLQGADADAPSRALAEGEQVAEWIASRGGDLRQYAILFRRGKFLDDYLDALDRYHIPYVLPPTRLFLDRPAAVDLVTVLRAIAYPFDRGAAISAARSPYFALTDLEIVRGSAWSAAATPPLSATHDERATIDARDTALRAAPAETPWQQFEHALHAFRDASHHLTVSALIDHVIAATGIEAVYDASADGPRALRHLEHLRAIAFGYDRKIGGSVRQFVDEIAQRRREPEEPEPSLADDSSDAVRVLTIHAAKGLEFDTVILPDLGFRVNEQEVYAVDEPRSLVYRDKQFATLSARRECDGRKLKEIGQLREEAETRRLFYVAVTRAKRDVVFVSCESKQGFGKYVRELFGEPSFPEEPGREVKLLTIGAAEVPVAFERMLPRQTGARRRRRLADDETERTLAALPPVDMLIDLPPQVVEALTPADAAKLRARSRNRAAGIALHRFLERWDGVAPPEPLLAAIANEQGIDDAVTAKLRQRIAVIRNSPTFRRIAAAETLGREVPVRFAENGAVVERRIDRWIREDDVDVVVDYKSGDETPYDRDQVLAYCDALARITGRTTRGLLWYIDLDSDTVIDLCR